MEASLLSTFKLVLFIVIIIALAIKAGIAVTYEKEPGMPLNAALTGLFGFTTAGAPALDDAHLHRGRAAA